MEAITERLFNRRYQLGRGLLANLFMGVTTAMGFMTATLLAFPFLLLLGPFAAAMGSLLAGTTGGIIGLWVGLDHFGLLGNRGLRRRVEQKLESLGELRDLDTHSRQVHFVGLSHPVRESWLRWETDDDVGFLEITSEELRYRGDSLSFDISAANLSSVELVPVGGFMPRSLKRIRITTWDGEPFDAINFDSREYDRYFAAQRDTHGLFHRLRALVREKGGPIPVGEEAAETLAEPGEETTFHLAEEAVEWEERASEEVKTR